MDPIIVSGDHRYPSSSGSGFHFSVPRMEQKNRNCQGQCGLGLIYRKLRSIIIQYNNCYNALPDHKDCLFIIHAFSQLVRDFYIYIF